MIALKILAACVLAAQPAREPGTLRGVLRHDPTLEGGVWTLTADGKVYDLHGDLDGRADGERVEVEGTAQPHRACAHQVGIVFHVARVRPAAASAVGPQGCERCGSCICRCRIK